VLLKPLTEVLEDLLYEADDDGLEACLAETSIGQGAPEDVHEEYAQRYLRAVGSVREARGAPQFEGDGKDGQCPEWLRADKGTVWSDSAGHIYVALRHEGDRLQIIGGARPRPLRHEAVTLMPPSE